MKHHTIAGIAGDRIGQEVTPAALAVAQANGDMMRIDLKASQ